MDVCGTKIQEMCKPRVEKSEQACACGPCRFGGAGPIVIRPDTIEPKDDEAWEAFWEATREQHVRKNLYKYGMTF